VPVLYDAAVAFAIGLPFSCHWYVNDEPVAATLNTVVCP
jgi:hypothetical protein